MASAFVRKHLANDGLHDALNAFFGGMCTPRCDTCFMSILVVISLFMAAISGLMVAAAEFTRYPSERSFGSTVVCLLAFLTFVVFAVIAWWFGLAVKLPWFDS